MNFQHWPEIGDYLKANGLIGPMADIGACTGNWTMTMLEWGAPTVYAIDLWGHSVRAMIGDLREPQEVHDRRYEEFMERIEPHRERVVVLRGHSRNMASAIPDGSLVFAYQDCGHTAGEVMADLEEYWPKMYPGAIYAGHDYFNPDFYVRESVDKFAKRRGLEVGVIPESEPTQASFWFQVPKGEEN